MVLIERFFCNNRTIRTIRKKRTQNGKLHANPRVIHATPCKRAQKTHNAHKTGGYTYNSIKTYVKRTESAQNLGLYVQFYENVRKTRMRTCKSLRYTYNSKRAYAKRARQRPSNINPIPMRTKMEFRRRKKLIPSNEKSDPVERMSDSPQVHTSFRPDNYPFPSSGLFMNHRTYFGSLLRSGRTPFQRGIGWFLRGRRTTARGASEAHWSPPTVPKPPGRNEAKAIRRYGGLSDADLTGSDGKMALFGAVGRLSDGVQIRSPGDDHAKNCYKSCSCKLFFQI